MTHTVLSLRQPWAGLLVTGVKKFELRTWRPMARSGWLLIHASAGKATGLPGLRAEPMFQRALARAGMKSESDWEQSAIVGAVHFRHFRDWYKEGYPTGVSEVSRFLVGDQPPQFLWEVGRAYKFTQSLPCKGKLKLWITDGVLARSASQRIRYEAPEYVKWS
jgi:hypothetical protein